MKTSEVLNKAADLIEKRGWTQGDGWPGAPGYDGVSLCLEGGIMAALGVAWGADGEGYSQMLACPAHTAVRDYLDVRLPFLWNDKGVRTAAEVIEVLRATAVIEAAREDAEVREQVSA